MFTDAQQRALVEIARSAVREAVTGERSREDHPDPGPLPEATGAFVTLKRDGQLRGCIGTLECRRPLVEEIARVAVSAEVPTGLPIWCQATATVFTGGCLREVQGGGWRSTTT